jgi:hypothetical protein
MEMRARCLEPKPKLPLLGYSVSETMAAARSIRSPRWRNEVSSYLHDRSQPCNLGSTIKSQMDVLEGEVSGLTLVGFIETRPG